MERGIENCLTQVATVEVFSGQLWAPSRSTCATLESGLPDNEHADRQHANEKESEMAESALGSKFGAGVGNRSNALTSSAISATVASPST